MFFVLSLFTLNIPKHIYSYPEDYLISANQVSKISPGTKSMRSVSFAEGGWVAGWRASRRS